jgi:predicted membrane protein
MAELGSSLLSYLQNFFFWWIFQSSPINWFIFLVNLIYLVQTLYLIIQFKNKNYKIKFKKLVLKKKYVN